MERNNFDFNNNPAFDPNMVSNDMYNPMMQYEQTYMYYKCLCMQMEYKIRCKEYEKLCGQKERKIE